MAIMQRFDADIERTRTAVEQMRDKVEQAGLALDRFAREEASLDDIHFDVENARIQDVLAQQQTMEACVAELIIGLENAANAFGAEFASMKTYTGYEKIVGIFSRSRMQRMHTDRARKTSLAGNVRELLAMSDTIIGLLKEQKKILSDRYKAAEASLIQVMDRRKLTIVSLEGTQRRIEELNSLLFEIDKRITATTDQRRRTLLEGERSKLAAEHDEKLAEEQELSAESHTLGRYTTIFQTFVDSLNDQIAAQNTLLNKLTIDTQQRVVLYKALEDFSWTTARHDVAHGINLVGSHVGDAVKDTTAIGFAVQEHIGDLIAMHEKDMLAAHDIQRRKERADDAFAGRFRQVMEKDASTR